MRPNAVIETLSAAVLTKYVTHDPFAVRGGIFLIAPPGNLKSTLIKNSIEGYTDCLNLNDLNVQTLSYLKNSIVDGRYSALAFGEFEKLYQRNPSTASNIEGHLKAMVEEGFGKGSFEDQRGINVAVAKIALLGGVTPSCYQRRSTAWMENGFMRRFLWASYTLANPKAIEESVHRWKRIDFGKVDKRVPASGSIPFNVNASESMKIRELIKDQFAHETPFILSKKIFAVLKWRHKKASRAMEIFEEFSECLNSSGAKLVLNEAKR